MKKILLPTLIATTLAITSVQKTQAGLGAVAYLINPAVATKLAIAGISSYPVGRLGGWIWNGFSCKNGSCTAGGVLGLIVGLVLLDEDSQDIAFSPLSFSDAEELEISTEELRIYNQEVGEATILFQEAQDQLRNKNNISESRMVWNELQAYLQPETFKVMQRIIDKSLENIGK